MLVGNDWVAYRPRVVVFEATARSHGKASSGRSVMSRRCSRHQPFLRQGGRSGTRRTSRRRRTSSMTTCPGYMRIVWPRSRTAFPSLRRRSYAYADVLQRRRPLRPAQQRALHETLVETADTARKPLSTKWKRHRSTGRTGAPPRDSISAVNRNEPVPLPPLELMMRVGARPEDPLGSYLEIGRSMMAHVRRLLPDERPLENARFLDFGCGAGRTLRLLLDIPGISLTGCDIHEESIKWVRQHMPQVNAFVNDELPPLPIPDRSIDIVWAGSVFTHLDETWSAWILEMHRILDRGGVLVASFLASGMSETIAHEPWDENRIGMNTLMRGNPWDEGGPSILLSPWWIREHWGRAFEVLTLEPEGFGFSWRRRPPQARSHGRTKGSWTPFGRSA